jgi:Inner membrane protein YgaP-like, transmembrane domain
MQAGRKEGGKPMSYNVGGIDRVIRIVLGFVLLGLAFFHVLVGTLAIIAYVLGGIVFLTGVVRFCPAWAAFGINTCAAKRAGSAGSGQ